jgi:Flp pilus assembly protein TadB
MSALVIAVLIAAAAALAVPHRLSGVPARAAGPAVSRTEGTSGTPGASGTSGSTTPGARPDDAAPGWVRRGRPVWAVLAGIAALIFLGGTAGRLAAVPVGLGCWILAGRVEGAGSRRRRERLEEELPVVVLLLAAALEAGAAPTEAVGVVRDALPGPAADALAPVEARLRLGADPVEAWGGVGAELAPLGRAMARSQLSGAPVVVTLARLATELGRAARARAEDRARSVGVRAAVPLGLCLLPSFLLIGIVPVVGGLLGTLGL